MVTSSPIYSDDNKLVNIRPNPKEIVSFKEAGNSLEIKYSKKHSNGGTTRKISKDFYINTKTGELNEFHHQEKRMDDTKSVSRSLNQGKDIINANFTDPKKCRFLTVTYADNMTDEKKLYNDLNYFIKKLKKEFQIYKYCLAIEPQGRGAWHAHIIIGWKDKVPFFPYDKVLSLWGHGGIYITEITGDCDNLGQYLCSYLSDMPLDEAENLHMDIKQNKIKEVIADENGKKIPKRVVKGARLSMYPSGMHIFRWSRNCIKPTIIKCTNEEAEKAVDGLELLYETTRKIVDTSSGFENTTNYRAYNKKRRAVPIRRENI